MIAAETMIAIEISMPGGPEVLKPVERPTPEPTLGEVLIAVEAAGLNRGDLMQRQGYYPRRPAPAIFRDWKWRADRRVGRRRPGLAGRRPGLRDFGGRRLCRIRGGAGGAVPAHPWRAVDDRSGALPETLFTCWTNLIDDGRLVAGETLLIHVGHRESARLAFSWRKPWVRPYS